MDVQSESYKLAAEILNAEAMSGMEPEPKIHPNLVNWAKEFMQKARE